MSLTTAAAVAGAADSGVFLLQRRRLVTEAPGRAAGIVAAVALWSSLALASRARRRGTTLALASVTAAGQGAMLAAHLRRGIAGPRVWGPAGLAAAALAGAVRAR